MIKVSTHEGIKSLPIDPIIPLNEQTHFTSHLYDANTEFNEMCFVYCHYCTGAELYTPQEREKAKLQTLPKNPRRDFLEVKKCPDCKRNGPRS